MYAFISSYHELVQQRIPLLSVSIATLIQHLIVIQHLGGQKSVPRSDQHSILISTTAAASAFLSDWRCRHFAPCTALFITAWDTVSIIIIHMNALMHFTASVSRVGWGSCLYHDFTVSTERGVCGVYGSGWRREGCDERAESGSYVHTYAATLCMIFLLVMTRVR